MEKRIILEGKQIYYNEIRRDIKYPRLELRTGELNLIIPKKENEPKKILMRHKNWIFGKLDFINKIQHQSKFLPDANGKTKDELKEFSANYISRISEKYSLQPNKIIFRNMVSKWGSCSNRNNLTLNTLLGKLPEHLIKYVIFHEMCHITEKEHNTHFWTLMVKEFPNYQELEEQLFMYWLKHHNEKKQQNLPVSN